MNCTKIGNFNLIVNLKTPIDQFLFVKNTNLKVINKVHTILGNLKNTPQYGQCQKDAVLDLEKLNTFAYYTTLYSYCCFCHLSSDQAKNSSRYCKRDVYLLQSIKFASWLLLLCSTISIMLWLRLGTNVKFCTTARVQFDDLFKFSNFHLDSFLNQLE